MAKRSSASAWSALGSGTSRLLTFGVEVSLSTAWLGACVVSLRAFAASCYVTAAMRSWRAWTAVLLVTGCIEGGEAEPLVDCAAPEHACGTTCVDLQADAENCGECGNACGKAGVCSRGECLSECPESLSACGGACRDLSSDVAHCGACDAPCVEGFECVDGACLIDGAPVDERVRSRNAQLTLCGRPIYMNGANTPWHRWNDFGGDYDAAWWSEHYASLHETGVNSSRVWITCDGSVGIDISAEGEVLGATPEHWQHLDSFFAIASEQRIYVMATLMSFDHFESRAAAQWQAWLASDALIDSYIENYLRPFLDRYGTNPQLWAIDLMNEPDWVVDRHDIGWDRLRAYFARGARAIHEHSEVLVTVGMASPQFSAPCPGCQPAILDSQLRETLDEPSVYLDFYSPHYYDWVGEVWGNSLHLRPQSTNFPPGKPMLIGEHPAHGSAGHTLTEDVESAWSHGWQGTLPWTSNGVDRNGGFAEVSVASAAFRDAHTMLVFPSCR